LADRVGAQSQNPPGTQTNIIMHNIEKLREKLWSVIERIEKEPRFVSQAVEINNAAGKLINSAKVQMEYHHLRKEKPDIAFLSSTPSEKA
jgi:hypothetical protein